MPTAVTEKPVASEMPFDGVIATGVSLEEYERVYAPQFCEWVEGTVIKMGVSSLHDGLTFFVRVLLDTYFELRPVGKVYSGLVIKLPELPGRRREPDLMVILMVILNTRLLDALRQEAHFYRLNEAGLYKQILPDAAGSYTTPLLPGLQLPVAALWPARLPGPLAIGKMVQQMLQAENSS